MEQTTAASFGDMLRSLRKRRRFSQQTLATLLGVHRNTIGIWERGDFLPESQTVVLELARQLRLTDQETRALLEASLTALASYWYVPFPRNPFFTGRQDILAELHSRLNAERTAALTQSTALHGLGGVGKTQIALEYAYQYAMEYNAIFWIGAETDESMLASLAQMAEQLQLPERTHKDQQRVLAAVQRWLATHRQWLLILDNVEDLDLLERFLPATRSGALLITSRRQALGVLARGLDLSPMEPEEGVLFLLRRAKLLAPEATREQVQQFAERMPTAYASAQELVAVLGGLPLALDQAGAYLEETQCSVQAYLDLFHTRRAALLQQRGEAARNHPASVSTTFSLAVISTAKLHPAIGDFLRVCALLQSEAIPEALFRQGAVHLGETLEAACRDSLEWDRLLAVACSYSLLGRQAEAQTLSLHRLVQAVLLDTMTEEERRQWSERIIAALNALFPEVMPSAENAVWEQQRRYLPHALLCLHRTEVAEGSLNVAHLAHKVAQYLRTHGRYTEAEQCYQLSLRIRERHLGTAHPDLASSLSQLAVLYQMQGKHSEAEQLYMRALNIMEQCLGPDHLRVAYLLNNIATLYWAQGKYSQAEQLYKRSLSIREQILEPDHFMIAALLNNLGVLCRWQGKYAEAESIFLRALALVEQSVGTEHPNVAYPLNNLGNLYFEQERYSEAEPLYNRAMILQEPHLAPDHPDLAETLNNQANLCREQGKYAEARQLYQRALHIWEQALGSDHLQTATVLHGLATLASMQGKYVEAEKLYQRVLSVREKHLGPNHPETAQIVYDLALLRQKQGKLALACSLAERALQMRSQSLGNEHPKTVASRALYTRLLQERTTSS